MQNLLHGGCALIQVNFDPIEEIGEKVGVCTLSLDYGTGCSLVSNPDHSYRKQRPMLIRTMNTNIHIHAPVITQ